MWINNLIELCGVLKGKPEYSHRSRDERYYTFPLEIERLSGVSDVINIMARESLLDALELSQEPKITIRGELRSFNNKSGRGSRLIITAFAREIGLSDGEDKNSASLKGVLCKKPNLRKTPLGREICDLMLAVNRRYGRSDYLPCIAWGKDAQEAGKWEVGKMIELTGRVQSRNYTKIEDKLTVEKTAYEVSVITIGEWTPT